MIRHKDRVIQTPNALAQDSGSLKGIHDVRLVAGLFFVHHLSGDLRQADPAEKPPMIAGTTPEGVQIG